ncbi:unnamed protein product [Auanema sp. JU1783]|nr:unnamed protein product [Auanema sp. JU1783]
MDGDDENVLNEDLDVGDNYNVEVKPELLYPYKRPRTIGRRNRCPYGCGKVLAPRTIDYHRTNGCRIGGEEPLGDTTKKRNFCCGVCFSEFVTRTGFFLHLKSEHDVQPTTHQLMFKNRTMFDRFMRWIEMEGGAHFRYKSGSKRRASGRGIFMACNRSGFVGTSADDPSKNRTGPYRTGYTCTAFIHGTEHANGLVEVDVCCDHYGHDARMRLPNVVKQLIAQKQLQDESPQEIISYLKRQFGPFAHENIYAQRVCLVDLDELRTLMISSTKRWAVTGIPNDCEYWEEELLDRAGIVRQGAQRIRQSGEPTTQELADQNHWPRPRVFVPKMRTENGFIELNELCKSSAEARRLAGQAAAMHPELYDYAMSDDSKPGFSMRRRSIDGLRSTNSPEGSVNEQDLDNMDGLVRSDQIEPDYRDKTLMRRQSLLSSIGSELEFIERVAQFDLDGFTDSNLVSLLNHLRSIRGELSTVLDIRNTEYNPNPAQHSSQHQGNDHFSDQDSINEDEAIVASSGCLEFNRALWS